MNAQEQTKKQTAMLVQIFIYTISAVSAMLFAYSMFQPVPTGDVLKDGRSFTYVQPVMIQLYMPIIYAWIALVCATGPSVYKLHRSISRIHAYTVPDESGGTDG